MNRLQSTLLIALALGYGVIFADLQSDLEDFRNQKAALQSELKKLDQRISQTDSLTRDEARRFAQTEDRQKQDMERRRTELDALNDKISNVAKEIQAEKNQQGILQSKTENAKAVRTAMAKKIAIQCSELETLVSKSLPWDRETRLDRIRALRRDLENGNASPEEGLVRLKSIYSEEVRFGDEVVLLNKPLVRNDGETVNARLLRIGNQWIVYSDEEEKRYGILQRTLEKNGSVSFQWKEDLSFEERASVKLAIDIKLARKPPQMVKLPLTIQAMEIK